MAAGSWQAVTVSQEDDDFDIMVHGQLAQTGAVAINVNKAFGQADFNAVRGLEGFSSFGSPDQEGPGIQVSFVQGALLFGGADAITAENSSISIAASGVSGQPYLEVAGVYQAEGAVHFTGEATSISVTNQLAADADDESAVYGYMIENPLGSADYKRKATFSADQTTITVNAADVMALGVHMSADAVDKPEIEFARGVSTINVTNTSESKVAFGLWMHNSDANQMGDNAKVTVDKGASLAINVRGADATGLYVDDGVFVSNGDLSINVTGTSSNEELRAIGIRATGNGKLSFAGTTEVMALSDAGEAYALYVEPSSTIPAGPQASDSADEDPYPSTPNLSVAFSGQTALNGAVYIGSGAAVEMNGTVAVTGDFELEGSISGTGSLSINGQKAEFGNVMEGGIIHENAEINVGDLTFTNGDFTSEGDIYASGRITIGDGATYKDSGNLNAGGAIVLAQGGTYQSLYDEDDGATMQHDNGRVILQGGRFINRSGVAFSNWTVATDSEEGNETPNKAVLEVAAGDYAFNTVTVGANSGLEVTGGTLTLENLNVNTSGAVDITRGTLTVTESLKTAVFTADAGHFTVGNLGVIETTLDAVGGQTASNLAGKLGMEAGATLKLSGLGESITLSQLSALKTALMGSSAGTLDIGSTTISDVVANAAGEVDADKADGISNEQSRGWTVTDVTNGGISGAFQDAKLASDAQALNLKGDLTLVGSAAGGNLAATSEGKAANVNIDGKAFTMGDAQAANRGTVGNVTLGNGTLNIVGANGSSFTTGDITGGTATAATGAVVVSGAQATTGSITAASLVVENGGLSLGDKTLTLQSSEETSQISGTVTAGTLAGDAAINIGSADTAASAAGTVEVKSLTHTGTIFLDPVWKGNDRLEDGSFLVAQDFGTGGKLAADLVIGQNSTFVFGATKGDALAGFAKSGRAYGQNDVQAVLYVSAPLEVGNGSITLNGSLTEAPAASAADGSVSLGSGTLTVIDAKALAGDKTAVTSSTLAVEDGADIAVVNAKGNTTGTLFTVTGADATIVGVEDIVDASGDAMISIALGTSADKKSITYASTVNKAAEVFEGFEAAPLMQAVYDEGVNDTASADRTVRFLSNMAAAETLHGVSNAKAVKIGNQAVALAATSGVYNAALDASDLMNRSLNRRMTMAGNFDRSQGFTLWADVLGTANRAKSLYGDGGYDMDLYGAVLGGDVEVVPGAILGAALTVGTGSGGSKDAAIDVDNDADFVGVSLYGSHQIGNCNGMIDAGYMHTKSDLSAHAFGMSIGDEVSADAWTAGFTAEYKMTVGSVGIVPHIGIRWTRLDVDGYTGAFKTDDDTMDVFTLPVGVAFSGQIDAGSWKLAPTVDLSVVPSFGDDEATSKVRWGGASSTIKTQVVDDAPFRASLGLNAQNGSWTIGASYDLGVGGDDRLDNALTLRARYAF